MSAPPRCLEVSTTKCSSAERLLLFVTDAAMSLTSTVLVGNSTRPEISGTSLQPRTGERRNSLVLGVDVVLEENTLDAITQVFAPGFMLDQTDARWKPLGLAVTK